MAGLLGGLPEYAISPELRKWWADRASALGDFGSAFLQSPGAATFDVAKGAIGLLAQKADELHNASRTAMIPVTPGEGIVSPMARQKAQEQIVSGLLDMGAVMPLTFAGVGAKTADKVALQKAKQMANLGEDPVKIWQTTGWTEQFPDKKWRFEIPDNAAKLNEKGRLDFANEYLKERGFRGDAGSPDSVVPAKDKLAALNFGHYKTNPTRVADQYVHPQLFNAYPETGGLPLNRVVGDGQTAGSFRGFNEGIELANQRIDSPAGNTKSVLAHELQHAIQQREGFARGGSPEGLPEAIKKDAEQLRKASRKAFDANDRETGFALDKKARDLESMAVWGDFAPYELYKRLAGEAEARLTQARMNLTPAERMMRPPWLEFDVPPEQQIVRGLLGQQ